MTVETVKVQRAVHPADAPALVYAEGRDRIATQILDPRAIRAMGEDWRGYFAGIWHPDKKEWEIGIRLRDESW